MLPDTTTGQNKEHTPVFGVESRWFPGGGLSLLILFNQHSSEPRCFSETPECPRFPCTSGCPRGYGSRGRYGGWGCARGASEQLLLN